MKFDFNNQQQMRIIQHFCSSSVKKEMNSSASSGNIKRRPDSVERLRMMVLNNYNFSTNYKLG